MIKKSEESASSA